MVGNMRDIQAETAPKLYKPQIFWKKITLSSDPRGLKDCARLSLRVCILLGSHGEDIGVGAVLQKR